MRCLLVAAALAAAAPAGAVVITVAPTQGGFLATTTGYVSRCPTASGTPLGNSCVTIPTYPQHYLLYDGVSVDVGDRNGSYDYFFSGGSHSDNFSYQGTLTFDHGVFLASILNISEGGDDRGSPIITIFQQHGVFLDVPIRFPDGRLAAPLPEPAAWAMMVAGFGAIGCALRRRTSPARRDVRLTA